VRRNLHLHAISGTDSHKIQLRRSGRMRENQMLVLQLYPDDAVRQQLNDRRF